MRKQHSLSSRRTLALCVSIVLAALFLFPALLLALNSFKTLKEIYKSVLLLPQSLNFSNYLQAFDKLDYLTSIKNSLIITVGVTVCATLFCPMAAWVLARTKSRTSKVLFALFSLSILVPFQCVMLPLLRVMGSLHMMNRIGLMTINLGFLCPMSILLYHGFIKSIPADLEEAAAIDGCGPVRTFFMIVLPLLKGISATVAILCVMSLWNDFLLPSLTINKAGLQTLPLKTYLFFGAYSKKWNLGTAALVLAVIPVVTFYAFCQKYIIKGVTEGAVKG
ncbi:MAG: carbohydrate ABC transporter permease [Eubacteriales bacterium]|nr:carbohydrate ABC transporter permease [Eubacteriales bacterium]